MLSLNNKSLVIEGENLELIKLDTTNGNIEATGIIKSLRYQNGILSGGLISKITK